METLSLALTALVALEHIYFLYLEMFQWNRPKGLKTFNLTQAFANESRALAANQGLYNGFLAAGLIWGLLYPDKSAGARIQIFFLVCILVAGMFGAVTVKRTLFWVQGLPALIALLLMVIVARLT